MAINPPLPMMGQAGMSDVPTSSPMGQQPSGAAQGAKMVFRVVEGLKGLASAFPDVASDVDKVISEVERLGLTIMSQGSQGQAPMGFSTENSNGTPF